tara:strand:- start:2834 stop:3436 length:603 start_codon:yes stop_codon:yes gene_type:complete
MQNKLNIFCNNNINNFVASILSMYELTFLKLEEINNKKEDSKVNIIILNNDKDYDKINFNNLNDSYLIITNLVNKNFNLNNYSQLIKTPTSLQNIKNTIKIFVQNSKIVFHDIFIDNEKLTNVNNNFFCYLTKVELEILISLIREKEISKNFIKENILKIKSNIETNSLESHLTRIRKKMNEIQTTVKIQTRNEKLLITI